MMRVARIFALMFVSLPLFAQPSTWQTVQERVLDRYCIGCHAVGGYPPAVQTGLLLTADSAYRKLINVTPHNVVALQDSLVRVSTMGGIPGLNKSFFWHKINAPNSINMPQGYGSIMPLGMPFLTMGELAFVNRWISGGAPETGIVAGADTNLFNDTTRFIANFEPLPLPASGIQLHLGPFHIWPAQVHDREFLYFIPYPTSQYVYVNRYQIRYRAGSHHMIVYNYPTGTGSPTPHVYRDIRDSLGNYLPAIFELNNLFPFRFFVGTQTPEVDYNFPTGVALELPRGSGFDMNVHSVNRTSGPRIGEVYVNLHTIDSAAVVHKATPRNFSNTNIFLPPFQTTTISRAFRFNQNTNIIQMWAHAHQRMIEFSVVGVGGAHHGQLLYYTNDWEHPALLSLTTPMRFLAGDSLMLVTTYHNPTSEPIYYGLRSSDEMQFLFFIAYGDSPTEIKEVASSVPHEFRLEQNYPNPFNPTTMIGFRISEYGLVRLEVFDLIGRNVATLVNERLSPGSYSVEWNAGGMPSGHYFYRLTTGTTTLTRKALLIR
ncbi:MAG: T9SS type A sorting domain-containing protein [Bacteroidetes bacterium]|nr:T9SS type A sorting domain-containing protein [Bacteroidota bacterium]MCW5895743.1 T9SS type A sorting domain-containing protein [Bacteroidota bacterium]